MHHGIRYRPIAMVVAALAILAAFAWSGAAVRAATFAQLDQENSGEHCCSGTVDPGQPQAQTFKPSVSGPRPQVDLEVNGSNVSLTVEIRQMSSGKPTGSVLASTSRAINSGALQFTTFTFTSPPTLTAGTEYAIYMSVPSNQSERVGLSLYSDASYGGGTLWDFTDEFGWRALGWDTGFRTYVSVTDTTAPTVVTKPSLDSCSQAGSNGWCRGAQTAGFTASDSGAGLAASVGCSAGAATCDFTRSTTTNGASVSIGSGLVSDVGGNTNPGINSAAFKIDSVAPVVARNTAADACTVPGTNGWCRGSQTAGFSGSDATSGLANAAQASFTQSTMTEGNAVMIPSGSVADQAGNSNAGISAGPFKIDSTAPTVARNNGADSCAVPGTNGWCRGTQSAGFTASDATADLANAAQASFSQSTTTEGTAVTIASGPVSDAAGNTNAGVSAGPFKIDRTAPTLTVPASAVIVEATSAAGATASFSAQTTATDNLDPAPAVVCTPASGTTFPLGNTTVTCTATDVAGNTDSESFTVTVRDTTAPVLTVPANITVNATTPAGATVPFSVSATDAVTASPTITCTASGATTGTVSTGATFAIGTTSVSCTAKDAANNTSGAKSFSVTVKSAATQATDLAAKVQQVVADSPTAKNLANVMDNIQTAIGRGNMASACDKLAAFISQVSAQSGKKIAAATATELIADATRIKAVLGCA